MLALSFYLIFRFAEDIIERKKEAAERHLPKPHLWRKVPQQSVLPSLKKDENHGPNHLLIRKYRSKGSISGCCSKFRTHDKNSSISTTTTRSQNLENPSTSKGPICEPHTSQVPPPSTRRMTLDQYRTRNKVPRPSAELLDAYPSRAIGGPSVHHYPSRTEYDPPHIVKRKNFFEELSSLNNARQASYPK